MLLLLVIFCWDFFWADGYTVYPDYFIFNFLHILILFLLLWIAMGEILMFAELDLWVGLVQMSWL